MRKSSIASGTIWNLLGQGLPFLIAIWSIPILLRHLGADRFGLLTLVWMVVGYFSLFDFGIGRALTQRAAELIGKDRLTEVPSLVWTAIWLMAFLGLVGTFFVILFSPTMVLSLLKIPNDLRSEALQTFYTLAITIPFVICSAGFSGLLAAQKRFDIINYIRIPMGAFSFLAPVLVAQTAPDLFQITLVLSIGRVAFFVVHVLACFSTLPALKISLKPDLKLINPLVKFGSWMTISNIIGPLMVYFDRFVVSATISVAAVAYYSTPYEIATKLWLIPTALSAVLFPAFAYAFYNDKTRASFLFERGSKAIFIVMFPICFLGVLLSRPMLKLWLGVEFADHSSLVLQVILIGVFINSIAYIPYNFIQAIGRPDITAKFHLAELIPYLLLLWYSIKLWGINGAAFSWATRVFLDLVILIFWVALSFPDLKLWLKKAAFLFLLSLFAILASIFTSESLHWPIALIVPILFFLLVWRFVFSDIDRQSVIEVLHRRYSK